MSDLVEEKERRSAGLVRLRSVLGFRERLDYSGR